MRHLLVPLLLGVVAFLPLSASAASCATLTHWLARGSVDETTGGDVSALQLALGVEETGYYGPQTEEAVRRYQAAEGIASSGDASTGYGVVGPKTIEALSCGAGKVLGASTISIGDAVLVTANGTSYTSEAGQPGTSLGTLPLGTKGIVVDGPKKQVLRAYTLTFVKVEYQGIGTGWTDERYLAEVAPTPVPPPAPVFKSCSWAGGTVAHGASITAYAQYSVPSGHACASQVRTCKDGVLSGTYPATACTVAAPKACTFSGMSIPSGNAVTAYEKTKVAPGHACASEIRTCINGVLSGSYEAGSCKVRAAKSCTFGAKTLESGQSITAYKTRKVGPASICVSESRTCFDGRLSGSYEEPACKVRPARACSFNGMSLMSGASVTAYTQYSVPVGHECVSQTRTCNDGTLSGSYPATSCKVDAAGNGELVGYVWNDKDGDTVRDAGETGYAGRTVTVSLEGKVVGTSVTDAAGKYDFPSLPATARYRVTHQTNGFEPTGGICNGKKCNTSDHSVEVTVAPGKTAEVDYGMRVPARGCTTTLREFGAKGDGVVDDTEAFHQAILSKCSIDGENLTYKITKFFQIEDRENFTLKNAKFIDAITGATRRVVYIGRSSGVTLSNLSFNRGSDPYQGAPSDSAELFLSNVENATLSNIEVYGKGIGAGVVVTRSKKVVMRDISIHDMTWGSKATPVEALEKVVGMSVTNTSDVLLENSKIYNLLPHTAQTYFADINQYRAADNMTDGIGSGGTDGFTIRNVEIWNVGEGIDMSGTWATKNFLIENTRIHDTGAVCYKTSRGLDDRGGPGIYRNDSAKNCGRDGFVAVGNVSNITYDGVTVENVGVNKLAQPFPRVSGIAIDYGYKLGTTQVVGFPTNMTVKNSTVKDTQNPHIMTYAFLDYVQPHSGKPNNQLTNSTGSGFTTAEKLGFDD